MNTEVRTRIYTTVVVATALVVGLAAASQWPSALGPSRVWLVPTLIILIALAGRFPFKVSPQGDASLFTVPLFMAVLLLPPLWAFTAGALGSLIAELLLRPRPHVAVFNVSNSAFSGGLSAIVFGLLSSGGPGLSLTPQTALAAGAAGLTLHVTNLGLLFGMITLIKGSAFWKNWKGAWALDAVQEGALLALGLIGALIVSQAGWGLLVLMVPFVLGYFGFRRSVEEGAEKARLAEELKQKLHELKEAQAQIIQSARLASVGTLAAGVAHEINNPTFAVTGRAEIFLRMMKKGNYDYLHSPSAIRDMETILREGRRIASIVNHLLDYSRRSETLEEVRIDRVMDDALELLSGMAEKKGFAVERDYRDAPVVRAVPNELQQVFMNLISNAVDAIPAWGTVTLACRYEDAKAVCYVKDTGVGIPDDIRDRIFEPFFTTKGVGKGTGLGLYLCHKIVSQLGGDISVESSEGQGTTVTVRVPAVALAAQSESTPMLNVAS